jgi:hypothetical protein
MVRTHHYEHAATLLCDIIHEAIGSPHTINVMIASLDADRINQLIKDIEIPEEVVVLLNHPMLNDPTLNDSSTNVDTFMNVKSILKWVIRTVLYSVNNGYKQTMDNDDMCKIIKHDDVEMIKKVNESGAKTGCLDQWFDPKMRELLDRVRLSVESSWLILYSNIPENCRTILNRLEMPAMSTAVIERILTDSKGNLIVGKLDGEFAISATVLFDCAKDIVSELKNKMQRDRTNKEAGEGSSSQDIPTAAPTKGRLAQKKKKQEKLASKKEESHNNLVYCIVAILVKALKTSILRTKHLMLRWHTDNFNGIRILDVYNAFTDDNGTFNTMGTKGEFNHVLIQPFLREMFIKDLFYNEALRGIFDIKEVSKGSLHAERMNFNIDGAEKSNTYQNLTIISQTIAAKTIEWITKSLVAYVTPQQIDL